MHKRFIPLNSTLPFPPTIIVLFFGKQSKEIKPHDFFVRTSTLPLCYTLEPLVSLDVFPMSEPQGENCRILT